MSTTSQLWYQEPASAFASALPIGNGRLGAMVYGGVHEERWTLNEDSIWYGGPMDRNPRNARENLPRLRQLVKDGLLKEAEDLVFKSFLGTPESMRHYEVGGEAMFTFHHGKGHVDHYKRWLDLDQSLLGVEYRVGDVDFRREIFASNPHGIMFANFTSSHEGSLAFDMRLFRGEETNVYVDSVEVRDGIMHLSARTGGGGVTLCISVMVKVRQGTVQVIGETIVVQRTQEAQVFVAIETTYRHRDALIACHTLIEAASTMPYSELRRVHISDYQELASLCSLQLGTPEQQLEFGQYPTDEWLRRVQNGHIHPCLVAQYFQYGRYLLISSTRPGHKALPANLQGIWNDSMRPPWGSKFTININLQMNYWPTETCNLSVCHQPLFDHIKRLAANGSKTAKVMYGCRGWVAHHNTDIWGDSAPQDRWLPATLWPMSGAWLCLHIWEHFLFTHDKAFLQEYWDTLRGSVEFFLDFLVDDDGHKVTVPSLSPENEYRLANGQEGCICMAPTIDSEILRHLFDAFLSTVQVLDRAEDQQFIDHVKSVRSQLPPWKIGKFGQLQEWLQDHEEVDPGHRHVSHLWGIFPGSYSPEDDQALVEACKTTLARRAAHGGGHTGWSRAWMIALWARLGDSDAVLDHTTRLLSDSTLPNLLNDHPPFQIDGNFGATAAIAEMLLQSHGNHLLLLPALPRAWSEGVATGICARGGFVVDIEWKGARFSKARILSKLGNTCRVKAQFSFRLTQEADMVVLASRDHPDQVVAFETVQNTAYYLLPADLG